jgi:arylsulfatase A-like enzyme
MPPNVIVVVLDACRRDALEPYGAPAGASAAVAQLAGRGAAYDEVYASACWTAPSHASFFTGKLPRALGLAGVPKGKPPDIKPHLEAERERNLAWVLRRAGYRTAAMSSNLWVTPAGGYGIGFDEFVDVNSGRQSNLYAEGFRNRLSRWRHAVAANADDGAAEIEAKLHAWLREGDDPFFCFVNLGECHSPYLPPKPYAAGSPIERIRVIEDSRRHYTVQAIWRTCLGGFPVSEAALARLRRQYAASIRYMDDWLARLLEELDRSRRLDETLVIVTADHGENFGEGGLISHGLSLDNRLIHVPFVAAGPGARDNDLDSLVGLPRFVAECAGLGDHPWAADALPSGVGVAQFDPFVEVDEEARRTVIERWGLDERALERFSTPLTAVVSGRHKLLLEGDRELWIDLVADPLELDPQPIESIPPDQAEAFARLRAALAHPAVTASRPFRAPAQPEVSDSERRDLEERMQLLGYL